MFMNFVPEKSARQYGLECVDCSDTTDIRTGSFVQSHETDFRDMAGEVKFFQPLSSRTDIAFGIAGGMFDPDVVRMLPLYQQDGNIGTPYGTLDSSSTNAGGTNDDEANFLSGDFEYGWRETGPSWNTRLFVGARAEMLNWKRTAMQDLSSSNLYVGTEESRFLGIGPRVGGSFDMPLGSSNNFGLFGGLSGGVLVGRRKHEFNLDSSSTAFGDLNDSSKTVAVPFVNAEVGVSANVADGITLRMGYSVGFASNILRTATVCTDDNDDDVNPYNDSCHDGNASVLTHGATITLLGNF